MRVVWNGLCNQMNVHRDGDWLLKLLFVSEEFLVYAYDQLALIASLPFVHTARRSYRSNDPANNSDTTLLKFKRWVMKLIEPYYLGEGEVVTRFP